ncbi:MAG: VWA domain-containing protein [Cocleimonas sp.]
MLFSFFSSIDWRQPLWLLLALQPLVLWLLLRWQQQKQQQKFADAHLLPWLQVQHDKTAWQKWQQKIFSRNTAYVLALLLFALSLAGPRLPDKSLKTQNEIILDVMLVVDLSRSMKATDIKPSRIRRATLEIYEFLSLAKNTRVGITVYAARPHLFVPFTDDFKALKFYLEKLDTLQLPTYGSDASMAMDFSQKESLANAKKHKQTIVWLTDGDIETSTISALKANIKQANKAGINTFILGLGTQDGGAIPVNDGTWLESAGQAVISKMDTKLLREVATLGGGVYQAVSNDESDWDTLYKQGILKSVTATKQDETGLWIELFPWTLFPAILFLLMAVLPFRFGMKI